MSSKNVSKTAEDKGWYLGISSISIIIIIVIFLVFIYMYERSIYSFADYDPDSNEYIATNGDYGLQYITTPENTSAYINRDSDVYNKKQNMLTSALTALEADGIDYGYVNFTTVDGISNITIYLLLILLLFLSIGGIASYASFKETNEYK